MQNKAEPRGSSPCWGVALESLGQVDPQLMCRRPHSGTTGKEPERQRALPSLSSGEGHPTHQRAWGWAHGTPAHGGHGALAVPAPPEAPGYARHYLPHRPSARLVPCFSPPHPPLCLLGRSFPSCLFSHPPAFLSFCSLFFLSPCFPPGPEPGPFPT